MFRAITIITLAAAVVSACGSLTDSDCANENLTVMSAIADTTITVGRRLKMRTVIRNECGEEIVPTYESVSNAARITAKDSVIGVQPGRAEIVARVGHVPVRSTMVSVVPAGRLSMVLFDTNPARLVTLDLDGSNLVGIPHSLTLHAPVMAWSRDRTRLAISGWNGGSPTTYIRTGNEAFRWLVPEPISPNLYGPVFSPDGAYVYTYHTDRGAIYRAHVAAQRLDTLFTSDNETFKSTTLSRDGNRLAFLRVGSEEIWGTTQVRILNLTTGRLTSFPSTAGAISWSPVSDSLAMIEDDAVKMVAVDGSGKRTISHPMIEYFDYVRSWPLSLTWSPDGKWLIAGAILPGQIQQMDLIEVATGLTIPLPYTRELQARAPFWMQ